MAEPPFTLGMDVAGVVDATGEGREAVLAAYREIMPQNDLVAVSFYPFIRGGTTDIDGCLRWLTENFGRYGKPYAVVESGEAAERLVLKSGQVIAGTPGISRRSSSSRCLFTPCLSWRVLSSRSRLSRRGSVFR